MRNKDCFKNVGYRWEDNIKMEVKMIVKM